MLKTIKTLPLLLTVLFGMAWQSLSAAGSGYSLVVYTVSGVRTAFAFSDRPTMTIEGTTFHIKSSMADAEYASADIERFTLEEGDTGDNDNTDAKSYWLIIHKRDGKADGYAFANKPEVTVLDKLFQVTIGSRTLAYPWNNIEKFTIEAHEPGGEVTAIDLPAIGDDSPQLRLIPGTVSLKGLEPGTSVRIYDAGGKMATEAAAGTDGSLSISLETLPQGVYVVKCEKASFKILRK